MSDSVVGFPGEMKRRKIAGSSSVSQNENEFSGLCRGSPPIVQQHEGRDLRVDLSSDDDEQWKKYDQLQKEVLNSEKWVSVGEYKRMKEGLTTIFNGQRTRANRKRNRQLIASENENCQEDGGKGDWCLGQLLEGAGDVTMVSGQHLEESESVEAESESRRSRENEQMSNHREIEKDSEKVDKLKVLNEECSSCQKISIPYLNSYHFKLYQLINSGAKAQVCDVCSMAHVQSMLPWKEQFSCEVCSKLFSSKYHATNHAYIHMTKEELDKLGVFYDECHTCNKIFFDKSRFKEHQLFHSGIKSHICGHCSMAFTQKSNLVRHANVHLNPQEKEEIKSGWKNVCYFCDQKFKAPSGLVFHFPIHIKERAFRCNVCQKTFTQQGHLTSHKKIVHEKRRQFICENCGKSFGTKQELKTHSVVHSGARPFPCPQCDKTFTQNSSLNTHLKSVHLGVRHQCLKCSKSFSMSYDLKNHVKNAHK